MTSTEVDQKSDQWGATNRMSKREMREKKKETKRVRNELRLQALNNATPFKTGWEMQKSRSPWDLSAPSDPPLHEERWVCTPKLEESFYNCTYMSMEEIEWRQSQKNIDRGYSWVKSDDNCRQSKPKNKLRPPTELYHVKVLHCSAPSPSYSKEPIPDNGQRSELNLDYIDHEDHIAMRCLENDIDGVTGKKILKLGPSCSKGALHHFAEDPFNKMMTCLHRSTDSDPHHRIEVSFPDSRNYAEDERTFYNKNIQPILNGLMMNFIHLRDERGNFMCAVSNGLSATLHLRDEDESFTRLLCNTAMSISDLISGLKISFSSAVGVRKLTRQEVTYLHWKADLWQLKLNNCCANFFEVLFSDPVEAEMFYGYQANNRFQFIIKYPVGLDDYTAPVRDANYGMILKWFPYASEQRAQIFLKHPEDVGFVEQLLSGHQLPVYIPDQCKYEKNNTKLECRWNRHSRPIAYDDVIFENVVRRVLEANKIELDRLVFHRRKIRPLLDANIRDKIHVRMGRAAYNAKIWTGFLPNCDPEWYAWIHGNEPSLEWELDLPKMEHGTERTAYVSFKRQRYGQAVIEYLVPKTPDKDMFSLAERDDQGVRFYPVYTVRFLAPKPIRNVCDKELNDLDENVRLSSDYEENHWCRLRDFSHENVLVVEGWPREFVEETARIVKDTLNGRTIDCTNDGTDKSPARLLYGCGLAFVNSLQKKYAENLVISVDRLHEKITLWGVTSIVEEVRTQLKNFHSESNRFLVQTVIHISQPRFLPAFRKILEFNGVEGIGAAVGGAKIFMKPFDELGFEGSVDQYEALQEILDNAHHRMLLMGKERAFNPEFKSFVVPPPSPTCPACLMPAVGSYTLELCAHTYCLTCLTFMIRTKIRDKQLPIKCCKEDCDELVALKDIQNLMLGEHDQFTPYLFKERLQLLLKNCSELAIMQNENYIFCTKADCRAVINTTDRRSGEIHVCSACGGELCKGCYNPPHPDFSCEEEITLRGNVDLSIARYAHKKDNVKVCPTKNCQAVIEKTQGCNHMVCGMCKKHFCWYCLYTGEDERAIYQHLTESHGSTGGDWAFLDQGFNNVEELDVPPGFENMARNMQIAFIDGNPILID